MTYAQASKLVDELRIEGFVLGVNMSMQAVEDRVMNIKYIVRATPAYWNLEGIHNTLRKLGYRHGYYRLNDGTYVFTEVIGE